MATKAEERLDQLFLQAFGTNEPAMLDWVAVKMSLKKSVAACEKLVAWDAGRDDVTTAALLSEACSLAREVVKNG